jgi:uncharacterized protein (TIGR02217 family)
MSFIDTYLPEEVPGYPCVSVPRTKTSINVSAGGGEQRNQEWEHPLHRFILPDAPGRQWEIIESLKKHWLIMAGPANSFPFRDPLDFASRDLVKPNIEPTLAGADQVLGTADGARQSFQLQKTYTRGAQTYVRPIYLPVLSSVIVTANNVLVPDTDYTVTRTGGVVTFDTAPESGVVIRAGFLFDCEVRFESDEQLEAILRTFAVGGFSEIVLVEVRRC